MKIWYNNIIDTERHVVEVQGDRIRIGRAATNEIVLDSPYVADEAAVLYRRGGAWELVALGMNGVALGDKLLNDLPGGQTSGDETAVAAPVACRFRRPIERRAKTGSSLEHRGAACHVQFVPRRQHLKRSRN